MSFSKICFVATFVAFCVVVLGAYTRLSDAGLGCPDWPGCYGQATPASVTLDQIDSRKAWTEMIHRYFAGTLGLLILLIAIIAAIRRFKRSNHRTIEPSNQKSPLLLPLILLGTVIFQALLGMWTVTLLLHPLVVMGHLLGGMTTLGLCWWMTLTCRGGPLCPPSLQGNHRGLPLRFARFAIIILAVQTALGGWVSANYAALACPDFPTCLGKWIPPMDFAGAFTVWKEWGQNFEGGILDNEGRIAIQILHRIGAVVTFIFLGFLAIRCLIQASSKAIKVTAIVTISLLIAQMTLGISTVLFIRPLTIATAHNAMAALLLLSTISLIRLASYHPTFR